MLLWHHRERIIPHLSACLFWYKWQSCLKKLFLMCDFPLCKICWKGLRMELRLWETREGSILWANVISNPVAEDVLGAGREGYVSQEKDSNAGEYEDILAWHSACSYKQTCFKHKYPCPYMAIFNLPSPLLTNRMEENSSQNESLVSWTVNFSVAKSTKSCRNSWKISRDARKEASNLLSLMACFQTPREATGSWGCSACQQVRAPLQIFSTS